MKGRGTGGRVRAVAEGSRGRRVAQTYGKGGDDIVYTVYTSGIWETQARGRRPEHGQHWQRDRKNDTPWRATGSPWRDAVKARLRTPFPSPTISGNGTGREVKAACFSLSLGSGLLASYSTN